MNNTPQIIAALKENSIYLFKNACLAESKTTAENDFLNCIKSCTELLSLLDQTSSDISEKEKIIRLLGSAYYQLGKVTRNSHKFVLAREHFEHSIRLCNSYNLKASRKEYSTRYLALCYIAHPNYRTKYRKLVISLLEESLELANKNNLESSVREKSLTRLSKCYHEINNYDRAPSLINQSIELSATNDFSDSIVYEQLYHKGCILFALNKYQDAFTEFKHAFTILKEGKLENIGNDSWKMNSLKDTCVHMIKNCLYNIYNEDEADRQRCQWDEQFAKKYRKKIKNNKVAEKKFPKFKYHPDPIATNNIIKSPEICDCCDEATGYIYDRDTGLDYTAEDVANICPWCIASGLAADKYQGSFFDDFCFEKSNLSQEIIDEICLRTPGFSTINSAKWLCHCNDACEFHGNATNEDMSKLSGSEVNEFFGEWITSKDWQEMKDNYISAATWSNVFKFKCRKCSKLLYYMDAG